MSDVTRLLSACDAGDPSAAEQLLPLVYDELRQLAAVRLAQEKPGQTLQATALVHEAYLRLIGGQDWEDRGHFFAAAAEAMRRILVEAARRKGRIKRGSGQVPLDVSDLEIPSPEKSEEVLAIDEALTRLDAENPEAARLVKLRYFAGFSQREASEALGISPRKGDQIWAYARAWLLAEVGGDLAR